MSLGMRLVGPVISKGRAPEAAVAEEAAGRDANVVAAEGDSWAPT